MTSHSITFALLTLCSCTTSQIDGPIDYAVTGGLAGQGDGTPELHVEPDGTAVCRGRDFERHFTLDATRLAQLHDAIYDAELPLEATYTGCCDFYVDTFSVQIDGLVHSVEIDRSASGVPSELADLVTTMSTIASSCRGL